jgi:hypothetical protein
VLDPDELKVLLPPPEQDAVQRFDPAKVRFEDREGRLVPVLECPTASVAPRYNMAYLVFFVLTPVLILLIVLRLRALSKEGKEDKV